MKNRDAYYICGLKFVYVPLKRDVVSPKAIAMLGGIINTLRTIQNGW